MRAREATRPARFGLACVLAACASPAAADWREDFIDPVDHRFDVSSWLLEHRGFLPVPIIVTEPAVGYGGGVALAFFHRNAQQRTTGSEEFVPPSISGIGVAATENGTKFAGLGHLGIWRDDTLRYSGALAAMSINIKFYGGDEFPRLSQGIEYNIEGWGTFQQLVWRWPRSDLWLGVQAIYFDAQIEFDLENLPQPFDQLHGDVTSAAAGLAVSYDKRDNIITPSRGLQLDWYAREHWGEFVEDFDYLQVDGRNRWYLQLDPKWVLGLRADVSFTSGDVPFYALPSITQRGIARARYQGEFVIATEVEARYRIDGRWFGVAFGGVGRAADAFDDVDDASNRWAGGVGFRYLLARALGMQAGVDVAHGPDEWAFYIQMGSGWSF